MMLVMDEETKGKRGPKPKLGLDDRTLDQIRALGRIQATMEETAAVMRVSRSLMFQFMKENPEAREAYEDGKLEGTASLRRTQYALALDKNPTMLIWLGKQHLGQVDRKEMEIGRPGEFTSREELLASIQADLVEFGPALLESLPDPDKPVKTNRIKGNDTTH